MPNAKPHLVFVGCPWRTIRPKYERIIEKRTFKRSCPLHFVIVGRDGNQRAEDLFEEIKRQLDAASCALFDVSGGNANVALEFGYAQGLDLKSYVFVNEHRQYARAGSTGGAIISDLSGLRRNPYRNERGLERQLRQFVGQHPYTVRLKRIASRHNLNLRQRASLMAIPRAFNQANRIRRADLKQVIVNTTGYAEEVADSTIEVAKREGVVEVSVGQHGYTTLRP